MLETLADGFLGKGRNPETLDRAADAHLLHHPALDELTLLACIAAVDDVFGLLHKTLNDMKLLLHALVLLKPNAKGARQHGQIGQVPLAPLRIVVLRIFKLAEMTEGPGHLVAIALKVTIMLTGGTKHAGNVASH